MVCQDRLQGTTCTVNYTSSAANVHEDLHVSQTKHMTEAALLVHTMQ